MSMIRSVDATMDNFHCSLDGEDFLLDHIKQINFYLSIGMIGEPGDITITYDLYKMLDLERQRHSPVGKKIVFEFLSERFGLRQYEGVVTGFRKVRNIKQDLVVLTFDKEAYAKLKVKKFWKAYSNVTILEVFKDFLSQEGIPLNTYPENHETKRGTFWENFAIPQNDSTLDFLTAELLKDQFIFFSNPETGGVTVCNWHDMVQLDDVTANNRDYVVDSIVAKFDESKDQWKEATFLHGKQVDTRAPWKIWEVTNNASPTIFQDTIHNCYWYSSLKQAKEFNIETTQLEPNDIGLTRVEEYSGRDIQNAEIKPWPMSRTLRPNSDTPKINTSGYNVLTHSAIYPRYMYYRMQQSYNVNIRFITSTLLISGSAKAVVPMTTIPVTYFENAMNVNPKDLAEGDVWNSGLFIITKSQLMITGNNIMAKYDLVKPYAYEQDYSQPSDAPQDNKPADGATTHDDAGEAIGNDGTGEVLTMEGSNDVVSGMLGAKLYQVKDGRYASDNKHMNAFIAVESMGKHDVINQFGYAGLGQFGRGAWNEANAQVGGLGDYDQNKLNPELNFKAIKGYVMSNSKRMQQAGIPVNVTTLYLAHNQGFGGLQAIWNNATKGTAIPAGIRKNMNANGGTGKNGKQFIEYWEKRIQKNYKDFVDNYDADRYES